MARHELTVVLDTVDSDGNGLDTDLDDVAMIVEELLDRHGKSDDMVFVNIEVTHPGVDWTKN